MIRRVSLVAMTLVLSVTLSGQKTDFGIWYDVKAEHKIIKHLRFDLEASVRTDQNASNIDKFFIEPGLRYKFNDYFAAGIYYRFIEQKEDDDRYYARHRWFLQIKGSLPAGRFTLSARSRIQQQLKTYIEDPHDELPAWYHRLRLEIEYDIKGIPLEPYINIEMHNLLFSPNNYAVDKWRYIAGAQYTFRKTHTFGLEYIYNESRVTKPAYENLLGITYTINF